MSHVQSVVLTNMCLIEDGQGNVVMQIRDPRRCRWSSYVLPGRHIEPHEGLVESIIREVKEEAGLTINNPKLMGMRHWYTKEDERYLVFLYRASDYVGDIHSTDEGETKWIPRKELPKLDLTYDMLNSLRVSGENDLDELFYRERLKDDSLREFW